MFGGVCVFFTCLFSFLPHNTVYAAVKTNCITSYDPKPFVDILHIYIMLLMMCFYDRTGKAVNPTGSGAVIRGSWLLT